MPPARLAVSLCLNVLVLCACSSSDPISGARSTEEDPALGTPDAAAGAPFAGTAAPPFNPPTLHPAPDAGSTIPPDENICGVQDFDRQPKPAEVLLVLDRSGSMENDLDTGETRWEAIVPTLVSAIDATNTGIWWGLKSYPELDDTEQCAPESIVPTIHVPIAEMSGGTVVTAIEATTPLGDGTPTGDAIRFALDHLRERAMLSDNPKFLLLATDGEPNCPDDDEDEDVDAVDYTVAAIADALAEGFPTFVVGVDTSEDGAVENLNAMAEAGGRPRAGDPKFYLASTQEEIEMALQEITGEIASCVFDLDPPPPVPDNIAVDFNGMRAERDPTLQNGWEYTKDNHSQLEVYGTWCERIKSEAESAVNIKYGCPETEIPPPPPGPQ
jgi:hypothetical protein